MTTETTTWKEALVTAEKLYWPDQLRLISELSSRMETVAAQVEPFDPLTLSGVGSEVWSKIDTQAYLDQERDSRQQPV